LVERGIATDREQAARFLMAGQVRVGRGDGARMNRKPGDLVPAEVALALVAGPHFVSRGGDKLDAALTAFAIDVTGRVCLDVGASTGGFTDALLRRGAARVYALDVGRGQLAESLRQDPRVVSMERTHAARLDPIALDHIALPEPVTLAVIDVSFISATRVLRGVLAALVDKGEIVALVKPQFEAAPADTPRGVVRDAAVQRAAVDRVADFARSLGLTVKGEIESPLLGPKGNREFLLHLAKA
jgi:23S rRNA (cytidine1920-2'-O)/16S rRNA (cytidine1409-2'-O)-methyltransferase